MKTDSPRLLDPLINKMPSKKLSELAIRLNVSRITIWKWQNELVEVSPLNKLKINILCMQFGIDPIFSEN
jgi:DNA-binding XRE family transcriptional regulator